MFSVILKAAAAYIGTALDDALVLTLLFAAARGRKGRLLAAAGQTLAVCLLTAVSLLGARAAGLLPERYLFLLGLVPLTMGILGLVCLLIGNKSDDDETREADRLLSRPAGPGMMTVLLFALSDGGDNIGVWISVFAGLDRASVITVCAVFLIMTLLLCAAAAAAARLPVIGEVLRRCSPVLIPVVFILLGAAILLGPVL